MAVVVPAEFRDSGERILHELKRYGGDSVELVIGAGDLDEDLWKSAHLIAVGNFQNNPVVRLLYHCRQAFLDAAFSGSEGFMVKTVVDPIGLGKHVVLVGGSDASGIRSAVDQFLELVGSHGASLPRLHEVRSRLLEPVESPPPPVAWWTTTSTAPNVPSPEEIEQLLKENRDSYETGQGARAPKESWVLRMDQTYLDTLSMRPSFDPQDEYLLLDGTGTFGHGHDDANAILRLTWNDRLWIADLDYIRTLPRFHSSIEIIREGKTDLIPPLATLTANEEFDRLGFVRTELEDCNGTDRWLVAEGRHPVRMPELLQADGWRQLQQARRSMPDDRTPLSAPFDIQQLWAVEDGTSVAAVAAHQSEGWMVGLADGRLLTVSYNGDVRPFGERLPGAIGSILSISDLVVAGDAMANLTAFSPDGSIRWSHHLGEHRAQVESVVRIEPQQAPEGKRILVGTGGARVHAFTGKGENIWVSEIRFHGVSDLVTAAFDPGEGEAIVVGTIYHTPINVLDPYGSEKWAAWSGVDGVEVSALHHGSGSHGRALLVAELGEEEGPMILFGTETDEVHAVSPEGRMIWASNVGGQVNALLRADLDGDRQLQVVAATDSGYVTGLGPTGGRKWWRRLQSPVSDAVVVSLPDSTKSAIAVGMNDGSVALVGSGGEVLALGEGAGAIRYLMPGPPPESFLTATDTGTVSLRKLSR